MKNNNQIVEDALWHPKLWNAYKHRTIQSIRIELKNLYIKDMCINTLIDLYLAKDSVKRLDKSTIA